MKILIIGGTGTISYEFVKLLSKNKNNFITLINRRKKKKKYQEISKLLNAITKIYMTKKSI